MNSDLPQIELEPADSRRPTVPSPLPLLLSEAQERVDALRKRFASYEGGDRAPSPPVKLIRELLDAEEVLLNLKSR